MSEEKPKVYIFKIYRFNEKSKRVQTEERCKTKPISKAQLKELIKEEMARPHNKNAIWACNERLEDSK